MEQDEIKARAEAKIKAGHWTDDDGEIFVMQAMTYPPEVQQGMLTFIRRLLEKYPDQGKRPPEAQDP